MIMNTFIRQNRQKNNKKEDRQICTEICAQPHVYCLTLHLYKLTCIYCNFYVSAMISSVQQTNDCWIHCNEWPCVVLYDRVHNNVHCFLLFFSRCIATMITFIEMIAVVDFWLSVCMR